MWQYCETQVKCSFLAEPGTVFEFAVHLYDMGASDGTLNATKSALALVIGYKISTDSNISRFFEEVFQTKAFNAKKQKQKWEVKIVLDEMIKVHTSEKWNLVQLTQQTLMVLALATARQAHTISSIALENIKEIIARFIIVNHDALQHKLYKSTRTY